MMTETRKAETPALKSYLDNHESKQKDYYDDDRGHTLKIITRRSCTTMATTVECLLSFSHPHRNYLKGLYTIKPKKVISLIIQKHIVPNMYIYLSNISFIIKHQSISIYQIYLSL
ncbi:hypothetical protein Hanom_Chr12g01090591 [Helianthus anomalus]